jgi:nudix-type nucleoside diphosphatase (YffH/AdpP family)
MLIETCAGLLDENSPEEAIRRETEEETGYVLSSVQKVFEVYMSPGSVTEKLYFFIAEYTADMKTEIGGGVEDEDIEVLELPFNTAMKMIATGEIKDGKTIMLLQHLALSKIMG